MFFTNVLLKAAAVVPQVAGKPKMILVVMESIVSGHKFLWLRDKAADKLELIRWDPLVRAEVVFKEVKKVRSHPPTSRS